MHNAGMGGFGGSSYIDALILRDRDADLDENAVLEERLYYCQSWRADVVAVVDSTGTLVEGARYSAYGVPAGYEFWPQPAANMYSVRHRVLHSDLGMERCICVAELCDFAVDDRYEDAQ
jgi:hypothetical protein